MWRKGNHRGLLVGMQTDAATVENNMEFPQKTKNWWPFDPEIPLLGLYPKNPETPTQKNLCTPVFIAALFTIAKYWKQPNCLSVDEWMKKLVHLHNGVPWSRKKKETPSFCNSMDGTGEHCAKWNKPGGERQIPYDLTYKRILMNKTIKWAK